MKTINVIRMMICSLIREYLNPRLITVDTLTKGADEETTSSAFDLPYLRRDAVDARPVRVMFVRIWIQILSNYTKFMTSPGKANTFDARDWVAASPPHYRSVVCDCFDSFSGLLGHHCLLQAYYKH